MSERCPRWLRMLAAGSWSLHVHGSHAHPLGELAMDSMRKSAVDLAVLMDAEASW